MFFLRNTPSWIVVILVLLLIILFVFMGFGFVSIFLTTSTVLILSTTSVFFTFSKHKPESESVQNLFVSRLDQKEQEKCDTSPKEKETTENLRSTTSVLSLQIEGLGHLSSMISECHYDTTSSTSDDSEADWPFGDRSGCRRPDCSDGIISDEDSLIEIALPSGQYVGHDKEEETALINYVHKKRTDHFLFEDCIFKKHNMLEFLSDINEMNNEEENLIEIDLSIGSIKYPRFEIEA